MPPNTFGQSGDTFGKSNNPNPGGGNTGWGQQTTGPTGGDPTLPPPPNAFGDTPSTPSPSGTPQPPPPPPPPAPPPTGAPDAPPPPGGDPDGGPAVPRGPGGESPWDPDENYVPGVTFQYSDTNTDGILWDDHDFLNQYYWNPADHDGAERVNRYEPGTPEYFYEELMLQQPPPPLSTLLSQGIPIDFLLENSHTIRTLIQSVSQGRITGEEFATYLGLTTQEAAMFGIGVTDYGNTPGGQQGALDDVVTTSFNERGDDLTDHEKEIRDEDLKGKITTRVDEAIETFRADWTAALESFQDSSAWDAMSVIKGLDSNMDKQMNDARAQMQAQGIPADQINGQINQMKHSIAIEKGSALGQHMSRVNENVLNLNQTMAQKLADLEFMGIDDIADATEWTFEQYAAIDAARRELDQSYIDDLQENSQAAQNMFLQWTNLQAMIELAGDIGPTGGVGP